MSRIIATICLLLLLFLPITTFAQEFSVAAETALDNYISVFIFLITNKSDNGNITSGGTHTYTWDYNNRLLSSTTGSTTYNYSYDHEGNRVKKVQGSNATIYVNKYYEIDPSGKITKHIYGGDDRIALIETVSGVKTPYYVHKDHLGGSSVITDSSGNKVELVDYYPYGSTRLDEKSGNFESKYKFTGKEPHLDI